MSSHAVQIVKAALRDDVTIRELTRLASADPTFAARTLSAVNAAAFGLRERVTDLGRGAALLGVRGMRNVALGLVVTGMAPPGEEADALLGGCIRRGVAARLLAERARVAVSPDDAFVTGMLCDIALLTLVREDGAAAGDLARAPAAVRVIQERAAGMDPHPRRGAELAARWKLSDTLVKAIEDHHASSCPAEPLSAIVWGAEQIAAVFEEGAVELNDKRARRSVLEIGVGTRAYEEIVALLPGEVNTLADAFDRSVPQFEREDLLANVNQRLVVLNQSFLTSLQQMEALLAEKERLAEELSEANARLERMARTDSLTGVANRRSMEEALHRDLHRAKRDGQPLTLILVDVDHFKRVNDTYGHPAGDGVLVEVARRLREGLRAGDVVARCGGEEFAVILPNTGRDGALVAAERMRRSIAAEAVDCGEVSISVSASFGIATYVADGPFDQDALMAQADQALYRAKEEGRNRVMASAA